MYIGQNGGIQMVPDKTAVENFDAGKILIVDDEKFNCDIIDGLLMILGVENRQFRSQFAYNGEQAVKIIKQSVEEKDLYRFSLILMDCNMPFLDGYEATIQIRKLYAAAGLAREQQPKIVAVTGHVENEYVKKSINSGMDRVYPKPLPIKEFGQLLHQLKFIKQIPSHLMLDQDDD